MNKRGSHVGMVLSFIIFITFIVFVLSYLEPIIQTNQDKQIILDFIEDSLIKNVSSELSVITVITNKSFDPLNNCFKLRELPDYAGLNFIVKNESGGLVDSDRILNPQSKLVLSEVSGVQDFYKIHYSDQSFFDSPDPDPDPGINCGSSNSENVTFGQIQNRNHIFESKVRSLVNYVGNYSDNYIALKESFNVPIGSEFKFKLIYENGSILGTPDVNISIDVFSEEIPIQFVDFEANLNPGFLVIDVW